MLAPTFGTRTRLESASLPSIRSDTRTVVRVTGTIRVTLM